jgi:hypothetical protein
MAKIRAGGYQQLAFLYVPSQEWSQPTLLLSGCKSLFITTKISQQSRAGKAHTARKLPLFFSWGAMPPYRLRVVLRYRFATASPETDRQF